jgi:hypothetical protein
VKKWTLDRITVVMKAYACRSSFLEADLANGLALC